MLSPVTDKNESTSLSEPPKLSRARGELRVSFKRRSEQTVLDDFYQQGCLKARLPTPEPDGILEGVLINTSGGLTDGDKLQQNIKWGDQTTARITSQAAERIYRSRLEDAHIETSLTIGKRAHAQWLPQETILFNGGRLHRTNKISMAKGASLIATESLVFGRTAMREEVSEGSIFESWRIRYEGKLVFADGFHLHGNIKEQLASKAIANGANSIATLLYVGEDAEDYEKSMKQAAKSHSHEGARIGCSLLPDLLVIRILGLSGASMRSALSEMVLELMRETSGTQSAKLPKVWLC